MLDVFLGGVSHARVGTGGPLARPVACLCLVYLGDSYVCSLLRCLSFSELIRDTSSSAFKLHPVALCCNRLEVAQFNPFAHRSRFVVLRQVLIASQFTRSCMCVYRSRSAEVAPMLVDFA